jgi:hypothetical protein
MTESNQKWLLSVGLLEKASPWIQCWNIKGEGFRLREQTSDSKMEQSRIKGNTNELMWFGYEMFLQKAWLKVLSPV